MNKTVLVVDDQIGIRLLLEEVIQQEGYNVELALNGKEALDKIMNNKPDLIMLDYKLPIIDGPTLVKNLENDNIVIPTIMMSGLPEKAEDDVQNFKSISKTIGKPFQLNDIRELVKNILE
ncbi:two-component system, response regulator, stage 0 sporulation protein F [Gracilibacillus orientalis]|uniref:Two-component system, response regulator, stage 0 sporulation protein F n=1 Tax=Gracilibacillus orientalis TaxID=334253 RepID=A0A1I4NNB6_9BACI|nr:response regulator [Gracilibacillus orientalis]SFM16936.1 two-component system, response regulator, stage 0 sporulation protein F [Gracilibacillus orientalis]